MAHRDHDAEQKEFDNYWNSGLSGNKEDYERYLLIKSRLEGTSHRASRKTTGGGTRGASVLSFWPSLKWAFALALFINVTRILQSGLRWGLSGSFAFDAVYWVVASSLMWLYFVRYELSDEYLMLFDIAIPRSWPSWAFLGGWILARLNLNNINTWGKGIEALFLRLGSPLAWDGVLLPPIPTLPVLLKFVGGLAATLGGAFLLFDAVSAYRERH
jgi:hypothetical protein